MAIYSVFIVLVRYASCGELSYKILLQVFVAFNPSLGHIAIFVSLYKNKVLALKLGGSQNIFKMSKVIFNQYFHLVQYFHLPDVSNIRFNI